MPVSRPFDSAAVRERTFVKELSQSGPMKAFL